MVTLGSSTVIKVTKTTVIATVPKGKKLLINEVPESKGAAKALADFTQSSARKIIVNLNLCGKDSRGKIIGVDKLDADITVLVPYPKTAFNELGARLDLAFYRPSTGKWERSAALKKAGEISQFTRHEGYFSFKVHKWPDDDRDIGDC